MQVIGLVQWTPYTKYTNWVQGDPSTMDNNLSRIIYEVQNNLQWIPTSQYNYSFSDFTHSTDTPYNLAMAFIVNYERPADPNQPSRRNTGRILVSIFRWNNTTNTNKYKKKKISMGFICKEIKK